MEGSDDALGDNPSPSSTETKPMLLNVKTLTNDSYSVEVSENVRTAQQLHAVYWVAHCFPQPVNFRLRCLEVSIGTFSKHLGFQHLISIAVRTCTVPELRRRLEAETGVGIAVQRLIHRGRILEDDKSLPDYGVKDGHSLHMVERPPDIPHPSSRPGENPSITPRSPVQPSTLRRQGGLKRIELRSEGATCRVLMGAVPSWGSIRDGRLLTLGKPAITLRFPYSCVSAVLPNAGGHVVMVVLLIQLVDQILGAIGLGGVGGQPGMRFPPNMTPAAIPWMVCYPALPNASGPTGQDHKHRVVSGARESE
eukprot:9490847-Pyramimonas_sp.AAC.1